jgi:hypothetical protein
MSTGALRALAMEESARASDDDPQSITVATASFADAVMALGGVTRVGSSAAGESSFLASKVFVVIIRGSFVTPWAAQAGQAPPSGSVLELVIDAHTGAVEVRGLSQQVPTGIAALGPTEMLSTGS